MPIYEYECNSCHQHFDTMQKISEAPLENCTLCGAEKSLKKLVSNTAFHLKGGGWYKDLYASVKPGESSATTSKTTAPKTSETSTPAPVESKPKTDKAA